MTALTTNPLDFRIRRLGSLPAGASAIVKGARNIAFATQLSGTPILNFTAPLNVPENAGLDAEGLILAVDEYDGTSWTEWEQGRFIALTHNYGKDGVERELDWSGEGWLAHIASKSELDFTGSDDVTFTAENPVGFIPYVAYQNGKARTNGLQGMTATFTGTHDSAGNPWAHSIDITLEPDQSLLNILKALKENYLLEYSFRGTELYVANPGVGTTRNIRIGRTATEVAVEKSLGDVATHVRLRSDEGPSLTVETGVDLGLGRLEITMNASGVKELETLEILGQLAAAEARPKVSYAVTEVLEAADYIPGRDYQLGDWVNVLVDNEPVSLRVTGFQIRKDAITELDVMLEDPLTNGMHALQRRAASLGARLSGNGRRSASAVSEGVRSRMATVDPAYSGDLAPRVKFDGETEFTPPVAFLAQYRPVAGDRVNVVEASSVGGTLNIITGKVVPEMETIPPGYTELLNLQPGWSAWNVERYGLPRVTLMADGIVVFGGMVKPDASNVDQFVAFTVPATLAPWFLSSGIPNSAPTWMTAVSYSTTSLSDFTTSATADGLTYNAVTRQMVATTMLDRAFDLSSLLWCNEPPTWTAGSGEGQHGYRETPDGVICAYAYRRHTASLTSTFTGANANQSSTVVHTSYNIQGTLSTRTAFVSVTSAATIAFGNGTSINPRIVRALGMLWLKSGSSLSWQTLPGRNLAGSTLQYTKTSLGLVILQGTITGGIDGLPIAQLPAGYRPQWSNGIVTADGLIFARGNASIAIAFPAAN